MNDKPPTCQGCPAYEVGIGYVPPEGPLDAPLWLLGQGPGKVEAEMDRPFFWNAPSGRRLNWWLQQAGALSHCPYDEEPDRSLYRVDNAVRCLLRKGNKDRAPTRQEMAHCRVRHYGADLERARCLRSGPVLVIPIGTSAIRSMLGPDAGEEWAGGLLKVEGTADEGWSDVNRPADWGAGLVKRTQ